MDEPEDPLLVSVQSGAAVSMPGMMDTVLNLGLNGTAVERLARRTGDERCARDSYRRFIQMFGDIVLKIDPDKFEAALDDLKNERGVEEDTCLGAEDLEGLIDTYKEIVGEEANRPFPEEPKEQLELAIRAVFDSWRNERAVAYRKEFGIPDAFYVTTSVRPRRLLSEAPGSAACGKGYKTLFTR